MTTYECEIVDLASEKHWLDWHHSPDYISASQAASVLGHNPWESAYTLWARKTGKLGWPDTTILMETGHAMEPFIAKLYARKSGRGIHKIQPWHVYRNPDYPWLFCTPDRFDSDERVVEIKNTSSFGKKEWEHKRGPLQYQIQNQIQLFCCDRSLGTLAALVACRDFYYHDFDRNPALLQAALPKLKEFVERCQNNDPPPVDGSENTAKTLYSLHRKDSGKAIASPDEGVTIAMGKQAGLKMLIKEKQEDLRRQENIIKFAMGDATYMTAGTYSVSWKHQHRKGGYHKASDSRVFRGTLL